MTRHLSDYQNLKLALADYLSFSTNIFHYVIGFALMLGAIYYFNKRGGLRPFGVALAIACVFGAGMEVLDRRDDLIGLGVWNWQHSAEDFGRTIIFPALALGAVWAWARLEKWHNERGNIH